MLYSHLDLLEQVKYLHWEKGLSSQTPFSMQDNVSADLISLQTKWGIVGNSL